MVGKNVIHRVFGNGKVSNVNGSIVSVEMENGDLKKFSYPKSFNMGVLRFEENDLNEKSVLDFQEENKRKEDEYFRLRKEKTNQ